MSIGIHIMYRSERPDAYHPVVSESGYHRSWLPLLEGGDFVWLDQLGTGFPVTAEDWPVVLEELERLMGLAAQSRGEGVAAEGLERMARARRVLQELNWMDVAEVFFG